MLRLNGRVALVTGAGQGLGEAMARRLAEQGATMIISDINPAGEAVATAMGARFLCHDVSSEEQWRTVLDSIEQEEGALHILVNNAGYGGEPSATADPETTPLSEWEKVFSVNATGAFLGCKHSLPLMARQKRGAIVNLSSIAAMVPTPFLTAYGASKAAVEQLSKSVALHAARHSIRCNSLHPGSIMTPMLKAMFDRFAREAGVSAEVFESDFLTSIPLGHFQEPIDMANAVLFLVSDEARFITGQSFAVDGGFVLTH